jgi:predicted aldo/keto reductase-like oxidoreductase
MNKRILGKNEVSILGFGLMRFPLLDNNDPKSIDYNESYKLLDEAIKNGVNYFDTAYIYHGGESEIFLSKYIKNRDIRDKIYIADKLPSWLINTHDDLYKYFYEQLEKLGVKKIDYYLLHSLSSNTWKKLIDVDVFKFIEDLKDKGLIENIGFSFHDTYPVFEQIINTYSWDFCQIQFNILDNDYQAGEKGLLLAEKLGIDVIIMEPLRGGALTGKIPNDIESKWNEISQRSNIRWSLDYIWNYKNVKILLSGMSTIKQVIDNTNHASASDAGIIDEKSHEIISQVKNLYKSKIKIDCTGCKYCLPCPQQVAIPSIFKFFNDASIFEDLEGQKNMYHRFISPDNMPSKCVECGICEANCPQNLTIIDYLKRVEKEFAL